jgi:hypothetical protein
VSRLFAACLGLLAVCATQGAPGEGGLGQGDAIDACLKRLDPQVDVGFDRVAARCPELARRLQSSEWAQWLPRGWQQPGNELSAAGLKELRTLVARELALPPPAHRPDVAALAEILGRLPGANDSDGGPWARFKAWLRELARPEPDSDPGWLGRMLGRLDPSQVALELLSDLALGAVVVLAIAIVLNELRLAGILRKRQRRSPRTTGASGSPATADSAAPGDPDAWVQIRDAPPVERPGLLLDLIAKRLAQQQRLPRPEALTMRELTRAAQLPDVTERTALADLAATAERVRFAPEAVPAERLEAAFQHGRRLLERLA